MNKLDLKLAMEKLDVKNPFKLAPMFQPPAPPTSAVETPSLGETTSQDGKLPEAENISGDKNPSWDDSGTSDDRATQGYSGEDRTIARRGGARKATSQDVAVLEAAKLKDAMGKGYTRLPNALIVEILSGNLSPLETRIVLLIARLTIGFKNRPWAPISKRVFIDQVRGQGSDILEALQHLEQIKLIRKKTGDMNNPNQYGIIFDEKIFAPKPDHPQPREEKISEDEKAPQEGNPPEDVGASSNKDKNKNINYLRNKSLSYGDRIECYLGYLKPQTKRESEIRNHEQLKRDFSQEEICLALEFLITHGTPKTGDPCHSPMAYLAMAMQEVLKAVREEEAVQLRKEASKKDLQNNQRVDDQRQQQEDFEIQRRKEAFEKAFPTVELQAAEIAKYAKSYPALNPSGDYMRELAILAWWNSKANQTQAAG